MALEDNDISVIAKAIVQAMKDAQAAGTGGGKGGTIDPTKAIEDQIKQAEKLTKGIKESTAKLSAFKGVLSGASSKMVDVSEDLEQLDESIKKATTAEEVAALQAKKRDLERATLDQNYKVAQQQVVQQTLKTAGQFSDLATKGVGTFVRGLQSGSSGIDLATGLMNTSIDIAGQTAQGMGNAAGAAGSVMTKSTNPAIKGLGAAAAIAGPALGMLGDSASKLAKFGVEILSKEVEKTVKSYQASNAAGAVFADGMTGLVAASGKAGLTVDQFSNVLSKHSSDLAQSGLSVTEGAKTMGRVAVDMRKSGITTQLQKLGYGFEEQAGLVAETTANMRRTAGGMVSDKEIATQTARYAESLRTIAAITGEDARRKTEESRQQNQILAFQNELGKKSNAQRAAIDAAMATMTEQEKKNFRDRVVLGNVINKEGAIYEATVDGARQKGEAVLALWNNNSLTAESAMQATAQYGDQIKESVKGMQAFGTAAYVVGGDLGNVAKAGLDAINQANIITKESVAAGIAGVQAQKDATDKLTASVTGAELAAQQLKNALQDTLLPAIGNFAEVSKEMLGGVQKMLKDLGVGAELKKGPTVWDRMKSVGIGAMGGAGTGAALGGLAGTMTLPGLGTVAGGTVGAVGGGLAGAIAGWFDATEGKANGGIASGPVSGFIEKLHGTELVIPLTDDGKFNTSSLGFSELMRIAGTMGNTTQPAAAAPAPAAPTTSSSENAGRVLSDAILELKKIMEEMKTTSQSQLDKYSEMLRVMEDNRDYTQRLMYNMS